MHVLLLAGLIVLAASALALKFWVMDDNVGQAQGRALRRRWDARHRGTGSG